MMGLGSPITAGGEVIELPGFAAEGWGFVIEKMTAREINPRAVFLDATLTSNISTGDLREQIRTTR